MHTHQHHSKLQLDQEKYGASRAEHRWVAKHGLPAHHPSKRQQRLDATESEHRPVELRRSQDLRYVWSSVIHMYDWQFS
jgi:hypothetical protein